MMRRSRVLLAIVLALLSLTGAVAASSHSEIGTASIHTTDTDFQNAAELTDLKVTGSGESAFVELSGVGTTATRDPDTQSDSFSSSLRGVTINPNTNLAGLRVEISQNTGTGTDAPDTLAIHDSSGTEITSLSGQFEAGDVVEVSAELTAGENYFVEIGGNSHVIGRDGSPSFPYSSGDVDIVDGATFQSTHGSAWGIRSVTAITSSGESGTYVSQAHTAEEASQSFINVSLADAHADYRIEYGGGPWQTAASGTLSTTGNHTIDISGHPDETQWRTNITLVNETTAETVAEIHDEGIRFTARSATVNNNSASPTGDLSSAEQTLSIDVEDADFALAQGDEVTVTFHTNRSGQVGTDTLTSNGTATASHTFTTGGTAEWWVETTDDYGVSGRSSDFVVNVPAGLSIRPEERPEQVITKEIDLTFYFQGNSGEIHNRTITDGSGMVDMGGMPTGEPFIVTAEADGYYPRRIYLDSLYESSNIYMLNDSTVAADAITFEHRDYSGNFPKEETVLQVQRALNTSGSLNWRTVEGDYFGATGSFETTLRDNVRHRLVLRNVETGAVRENFGDFIPTADETHLVQINPDSTVDLQRLGPQAHIEPDIRQLPAGDQANVTVTVDNQTFDLQEWKVTMTFQNSSSTIEMVNVTQSGPAGGTFEESLNLTGLEDGNLTVEVEMVTSAGETYNESAVYAVSEVFANDHALIPVLGDVATLLPAQSVSAFTSILAVLTTLLISVGAAARSTISTETIGFIGVVILGGFTAIEWFPVPYFFIAGVALVTFAGLRRGI